MPGMDRPESHVSGQTTPPGWGQQGCRAVRWFALSPGGGFCYKRAVHQDELVSGI
jgi:hypothetical protein